jgi:hypothetical protein
MSVCPTIHSSVRPSLSIYLSLYLWLYSTCGTWPLFQFLNLYTVGRTPWTGDQRVARPLPTQITTQTPIKRTDIHASSEIRTYDPSARAGEDGSYLRPRGHCDRLKYCLARENPNKVNVRLCIRIKFQVKKILHDYKHKLHLVCPKKSVSPKY